MDQNRKVEILKETAREYIEKYTERVFQFINEFEVDERYYIKRDIDFFKIVQVYLSDLDHFGVDIFVWESDNYQIVKKLSDEIGLEKIQYALIAKINFLEDKKLEDLYQKFNGSHDLTSPQAEKKTQQEIAKKFIAKEYALSYILDLYASGKQIPINKIDGGFDKKELINKGFEIYQLDKKKDTFYRAVKSIVNYDLNKQQDLVNVSQRWIHVVKELSKDWDKVEEYLKAKGLVGE